MNPLTPSRVEGSRRPIETETKETKPMHVVDDDDGANHARTTHAKGMP